LKIGIIGAMDSEVGGLRDLLKNQVIEKISGMDFYCGTLSDREVIVVRCGVGKVNAAICAEVLCCRFKVDYLINTGAAGSLDARINIGDVVLCTDVVQHDMDCVGFGSPLGKIPFMETSEFHSDNVLRFLAKAAYLRVCKEVAVFEGRIATGDQFICDKEKKENIRENFGALCCGMEGAAVAQTAYLNNVPFLIIRAISDKADDSAEMDYPAFERMAAWHSIKILTEMVGML
jgi:adenosylhomocysteine nucleosidase